MNNFNEFWWYEAKKSKEKTFEQEYYEMLAEKEERLKKENNELKTIQEWLQKF